MIEKRSGKKKDEGKKTEGKKNWSLISILDFGNKSPVTLISRFVYPVSLVSVNGENGAKQEIESSREKCDKTFSEFLISSLLQSISVKEF